MFIYGFDLAYGWRHWKGIILGGGGSGVVNNEYIMGITTSIEGKEHDTRNIGSCPTILIFINVVQINSVFIWRDVVFKLCKEWWTLYIHV